MKRLTGKAIVDSLTVEFSRVPGKTFHRKVLSELSWFFRKFVRLFLSEIILLWRFSFVVERHLRCDMRLAY